MMEQLFECAPFGLERHKKTPIMVDTLNSLHAHHRRMCAPFDALCTALSVSNEPFRTLEDFPYLPVRLFKELPLKSVNEEEISKILESSGTTSQKVSRIYLDKHTAQLQTRVLSRILQDFLGSERLPMILIDRRPSFQDRKVTARSAGIVGLSMFGFDHFYFLDENSQPNIDGLQQYLQKHSSRSLLFFGFTFQVWETFQRLIQLNTQLDLSKGILLHSGGWKKMVDQAVDASTFNETLRKHFGLARIHNFYGLAEQTGSIFVECQPGKFHASVFSDILIRDPLTLSTTQYNQQGLLQLFSVLPQSYPGHVVLTEDVAELLGEDDCDCGRLGKYFRVHGRLPRAELRGCSDVYEQN